MRTPTTENTALSREPMCSRLGKEAGRQHRLTYLRDALGAGVALCGRGERAWTCSDSHLAPFDRHLERIHRARRRAGDDRPVAVVDGPVAGAVEADLGLDLVLGRVVRTPGHGAAKVGAFPPQREEALLDA